MESKPHKIDAEEVIVRMAADVVGRPIESMYSLTPDEYRFTEIVICDRIKNYIEQEKRRQQGLDYDEEILMDAAMVALTLAEFRDEQN